MSVASDARWPLFRNHLEFLARHRGDVTVCDQGVVVRSEAPGFEAFYPLSANPHIPEGIGSVVITPWAEQVSSAALAADGYRYSHDLTYLELRAPNVVGSHPDLPTIIVDEVTCTADADVFLELQSACFIVETTAQPEKWRESFKSAAYRAIGDAAQHFYIAHANGRACAILLIVRSEGCSGIYAVGTLSSARGQGYSTALLERAIASERASGSSRVTLQSFTGSYAEGLYQRLGFEPVFRSQTRRRRVTS